MLSPHSDEDDIGIEAKRSKPSWTGLGLNSGSQSTAPRRRERGRSYSTQSAASSGSISVIEAVGEIFADYATGKNSPVRKALQKNKHQYQSEQQQQQQHRRFSTSHNLHSLQSNQAPHYDTKNHRGFDGEYQNYSHAYESSTPSNVRTNIMSTSEEKQIADAHATLSACQAASTKAELHRIYELWQHAKRELHAKSQEIADLRTSFGRTEVEARISRLSLAENEELLRELNILRERHRVVSEQLEGARDENLRWASRYESLNQELHTAKNFPSGDLHDRIRNLEQELRTAREHNVSLTAQLSQSSQSHDRNAATSKERLATLEASVKTLTGEVHQASQAKDAAQAALENQELLVQERDMEIKRLHRKIELQFHDLQSDARQASLSHQRDMMTRIDHLRSDNARLLKLLQATPTYKRFMSLSEVTDDTDLTYFPSGSAELPDNHLVRSCHEACKSPSSQAATRRDDSGDIGAALLAWGPSQREEFRALEKSYGSLLRGDRVAAESSESEHWVPPDAVRTMVAFRNRFMPHASIDLMGNLLRDLNKTWHAHSAKLLKRQKDRHQRNIQNIKRRVQHQTSYEEVMNRSRISRLDQSIRSMSNNSQQDHAASSTLTACMEEIEQLNKQVIELSEESEELREQLSLARRAASPRRGAGGSLVLAPYIRDSLESLLLKMDMRMRECMKRVANLHATQTGDPDLVHLLDRAHSAMMEDLGDILGDIKNVLGGSGGNI